jgi:protein-S-isoprenylcysteine O-methyltransferase Ste14
MDSQALSRWRVRAGYAPVLLYLLLAEPRPGWLLAGAALAFAGLAVRAWAAGHLYKHQRLATSGPYRHTQNPLYFGSALLAVGFLIAGRCWGRWSWLVSVAALAYLAVFYFVVMRREAGELRVLYGESYASYAAAVPLFLPSPWPRVPSTGRFLLAQYLHNREYQAAFGFAAGLTYLFFRL